MGFSGIKKKQKKNHLVKETMNINYSRIKWCDYVWIISPSSSVLSCSPQTCMHLISFQRNSNKIFTENRFWPIVRSFIQKIYDNFRNNVIMFEYSVHGSLFFSLSQTKRTCILFIIYIYFDSRSCGHLVWSRLFNKCRATFVQCFVSWALTGLRTRSVYLRSEINTKITFNDHHDEAK